LKRVEGWKPKCSGSGQPNLRGPMPEGENSEVVKIGAAGKARPKKKCGNPFRTRRKRNG